MVMVNGYSEKKDTCIYIFSYACTLQGMICTG